MLLCCGEALIDMIPEPTVSGQEGYVPHVGGAVFNTAIALGRLGTKAGMLTGMSNDLFGQRLSEALAASHVDTSLAIRSDRLTTLAFVALNNGQATYTFYDDNSAGRMLLPEDMPPLPVDITGLFFGGISLACEPCADAYASLLLSAAPDHVVMVDPNVRPSFIKDEARYRSRLDSILENADIVKISEEDLDWISAGHNTLQENVSSLLAKGCKIVVVTQGDKGATAFLSDGRVLSATAKKVEVVDTVGAGDTFNAGLLAALSQSPNFTKAKLAALTDSEVETALLLGVHAAAINVSRAGANPPWRHELERA